MQSRKNISKQSTPRFETRFEKEQAVAGQSQPVRSAPTLLDEKALRHVGGGAVLTPKRTW